MRSPLIWTATFVAMTSLALADPPRRNEDPKHLAREHVIAARTLHAQHRLSEALSELEAAYALDPQPQLLFAMGQLHVQAGRCERAIAFYQRFLASKPKPNEAAIAREAIQTCKTAPPPAIDPTQHPPREPAPRSPRDSTPPRKLDGLPITDAPTPPAPPVATLPTTRVEAPPPRRGSRAGYVVAGSLAVAALGAAAGSLVLYRGALDDREAAASARSYDAYADLVAQSDRKHRLSIVVGAVGAAALTSSVIVFVRSRPDGSKRAAAAFHVAASPTGAVASWRTPF